MSKTKCFQLILQITLECRWYISLLRLPYKIPEIGWLKPEKFISSQFWRLEVQDQGGSRVRLSWDFWEPSGCRWLSSYCVPTQPSLSSGWRKKANSLFIRTLINCMGSETTLRTSFYLNYFLSGPISKYSHPGCWGFNIVNLGGIRHSACNKWNDQMCPEHVISAVTSIRCARDSPKCFLSNDSPTPLDYPRK